MSRSEKIYFYEVFDEEERLLRQYAPPWLEFETTGAAIQESGHTRPPARIISVRTQSLIPESWLPEIKAVLSRSAGYDHLLPLRQASGMRIQLGYLPRYCVRAVAEQAALLWLALLRKLPRQVNALPRFHRDGLTGSECAGKTIVVVGVGNIGFEIVRLARRLEMKVFGVDIVRRHLTVRYCKFQKILPRADVIVAAMNLTDANRGYFSYQKLRNAKPGAVFVNIARGELSSFADLLRLLEEGRLGGVGLDVYENEPSIATILRESRSLDDPRLPLEFRRLARRDDVILTPHNAFNTLEAVHLKAAHTMKQLVHLCRRGRFCWPVPEQ